MYNNSKYGILKESNILYNPDQLYNFFKKKKKNSVSKNA